jgi:NitT/TauT family transport system permease protein
MASERRGQGAAPYVLPLLTGVLLVAAWHLLVRWTGTRVFPSPLAVVRGFVELVRKGLLLPYLGSSLARAGVGYLLAVATGLPLGVVIGNSPMLGRAVNPLIQLLRPISPIAWIPIAIAMFGIGNVTPVFLIFLGAVFPILVTTMNGVRSVPPMYLRAGRNFGLTSGELMRRVILPAMLPQMITGLRVALGVAWLVLVAAEMVAVDSGIGYLIIDSRNAGKRYDLVVAGMVMIGTIGLILDVGMRRMERLRSVRWGFHAVGGN